MNRLPSTNDPQSSPSSSSVSDREGHDYNYNNGCESDDDNDDDVRVFRMSKLVFHPRRHDAASLSSSAASYPSKDDVDSLEVPTCFDIFKKISSQKQHCSLRKSKSLLSDGKDQEQKQRRQRHSRSFDAPSALYPERWQVESVDETPSCADIFLKARLSRSRSGVGGILPDSGNDSNSSINKIHPLDSHGVVGVNTTVRRDNPPVLPPSPSKGKGKRPGVVYVHVPAPFFDPSRSDDGAFSATVPGRSFSRRPNQQSQQQTQQPLRTLSPPSRRVGGIDELYRRRPQQSRRQRDTPAPPRRPADAAVFLGAAPQLLAPIDYVIDHHDEEFHPVLGILDGTSSSEHYRGSRHLRNVHSPLSFSSG